MIKNINDIDLEREEGKLLLASLYLLRKQGYYQGLGYKKVIEILNQMQKTSDKWVQRDLNNQKRKEGI